jgi:hypothetical protein
LILGSLADSIFSPFLFSPAMLSHNIIWPLLICQIDLYQLFYQINQISLFLICLPTTRTLSSKFISSDAYLVFLNVYRDFKVKMQLLLRAIIESTSYSQDCLMQKIKLIQIFHF